jgi:hypothetical protein
LMLGKVTAHDQRRRRRARNRPTALQTRAEAP